MSKPALGSRSGRWAVGSVGPLLAARPVPGAPHLVLPASHVGSTCSYRTKGWLAALGKRPKGTRCRTTQILAAWEMCDPKREWQWGSPWPLLQVFPVLSPCAPHQWVCFRPLAAKPEGKSPGCVFLWNLTSPLFPIPGKTGQARKKSSFWTRQTTSSSKSNVAAVRSLPSLSPKSSVIYSVCMERKFRAGSKRRSPPEARQLGENWGSRPALPGKRILKEEGCWGIAPPRGKYPRFRNWKGSSAFIIRTPPRR